MKLIPGDMLRASGLRPEQWAALLQASQHITYDQMAPWSVDTKNLHDLAITTAKIESLAVTTAKIAALAVTDAKIDTLTVSKLTAGNLSVVGTITSGGKFVTGVSPNARIEITDTMIVGYSDATTKQWYADASTGKLVSGGGGITLENGDMEFVGATLKIRQGLSGGADYYAMMSMGNIKDKDATNMPFWKFDVAYSWNGSSWGLVSLPGIHAPILSAKQITLENNSADTLWFITENIARNSSVSHAFSPSVDAYGVLGASANAWAYAYVYDAYIGNIHTKGGDNTGDIGTTLATFANTYCSSFFSDTMKTLGADNTGNVGLSNLAWAYIYAQYGDYTYLEPKDGNNTGSVGLVANYFLNSYTNNVYYKTLTLFDEYDDVALIRQLRPDSGNPSIVDRASVPEVLQGKVDLQEVQKHRERIIAESQRAAYHLELKASKQTDRGERDKLLAEKDEVLNKERARAYALEPDPGISMGATVGLALGACRQLADKLDALTARIDALERGRP